MDKRSRQYTAYLLRLWQVETKHELIWRASLESPGTGERRGFASLADLCDFLQRMTTTFSNDESSDQ